MSSALTAAQKQRMQSESSNQLPPWPALPESVVRALNRLDPQAGADLKQWHSEIERAWNLLDKMFS